MDFPNKPTETNSKSSSAAKSQNDDKCAKAKTNKLSKSKTSFLSKSKSAANKFSDDDSSDEDFLPTLSKNKRKFSNDSDSDVLLDSDIEVDSASSKNASKKPCIVIDSDEESS